MGRGLPAGVPGVKLENERPGASAPPSVFRRALASALERVRITAESVGAAQREPTPRGARPGSPLVPPGP